MDLREFTAAIASLERQGRITARKAFAFGTEPARPSTGTLRVGRVDERGRYLVEMFGERDGWSTLYHESYDSIDVACGVAFGNLGVASQPVHPGGPRLPEDVFLRRTRLLYVLSQALCPEGVVNADPRAIRSCREALPLWNGDDEVEPRVASGDPPRGGGVYGAWERGSFHEYAWFASENAADADFLADQLVTACVSRDPTPRADDDRRPAMADAVGEMRAVVANGAHGDREIALLRIAARLLAYRRLDDVTGVVDNLDEAGVPPSRYWVEGVSPGAADDGVLGLARQGDRWVVGRMKGGRVVTDASLGEWSARTFFVEHVLSDVAVEVDGDRARLSPRFAPAVRLRLDQAEELVGPPSPRAPEPAAEPPRPAPPPPVERAAVEPPLAVAVLALGPDALDGCDTATTVELLRGLGVPRELTETLAAVPATGPHGGTDVVDAGTGDVVARFTREPSASAFVVERVLPGWVLEAGPTPSIRAGYRDAMRQALLSLMAAMGGASEGPALARVAARLLALPAPSTVAEMADALDQAGVPRTSYWAGVDGNGPEPAAGVWVVASQDDWWLVGRRGPAEVSVDAMFGDEATACSWTLARVIEDAVVETDGSVTRVRHARQLDVLLAIKRLRDGLA